MMENKQRIEPGMVPVKRLNSGDEMPAVGMGTFGSDRYDASTIAAAVSDAVKMGYRHIDCAAVYGNEKEIGEIFVHLINKERVVRRDELWITSKLWNDMHHRVGEACRRSLMDLHLDYLDLYLVHWPFPNFHAKGVSVDSRDPNARPYIHEEYMEVWSEMEKLKREGLVRNIGTSNMTQAKTELLLRDCSVAPACNEMELHPHFQQRELFDFFVNNHIQPIGFCPIGSPNRPERDKTPEDTSPIEDEVIVSIAQAHGVHPAVVCVKWAVQNGQIPIPFSVKKEKLMSNLRGVVEAPLTNDEMCLIATRDRRCRLIKGQVFTWQGAMWQDLWDENGVIKGW